MSVVKTVRIAHEIGHLLMHEAMFTEADRAVRDAEKEAHDSAANLLMPERRVEALLPHHASLQQILEAKRYFRVSALAMAYRAHTLGRLTDWEYRSVCSELSARGYRTDELRASAWRHHRCLPSLPDRTLPRASPQPPLRKRPGFPPTNCTISHSATSSRSPAVTNRRKTRPARRLVRN